MDYVGFKYPDVAQLAEIGPKGMLAKQHVCGFEPRRPVYTGVVQLVEQYCTNEILQKRVQVPSPVLSFKITI